MGSTTTVRADGGNTGPIKEEVIGLSHLDNATGVIQTLAVTLSADDGQQACAPSAVMSLPCGMQFSIALQDAPCLAGIVVVVGHMPRLGESQYIPVECIVANGFIGQKRAFVVVRLFAGRAYMLSVSELE